MAFIAALGALRAHQSWIDVIGNNLANTNTPGYKSSRALFADLLSVTHKQGTAPGGAVGGTNPLQVGLGVQLASVDRQMGQGALDVTGRTFDLALLGRGFFALTDGVETLYSRVGTFGLDAEGNMVDLRSGNRVLDSTGSTFNIDTSAVLPPLATSEIQFAGNLPAVKTGPLAEQLTSSASFRSGSPAEMVGSVSDPFVIPAGETWTAELVVNGGAPQEVSIAGTGLPMTAADIVNEINNQTEDIIASVGPGNAVSLVSERSGAAATIQVISGQASKDLKSLIGLNDYVTGTETGADSSTDLSALTINVNNYEIGDEIDVTGTDVDGTPVVAAFTYGVDGTTVGDLASFIDARYARSSVSFDDATGRILVEADDAGEADLSLSITDKQSQLGVSDWASGYFAVTTNGTGPDVVTTSLEVYDTEGSPHVLTFKYSRQIDDSWNIDVSLPPSEGTVISGSIVGVTFGDNGSIITPTTGQVEVQFGSAATSQTLDIALGTAGQFDGLTQFGNPASVASTGQDGYTAGELASLEVLGDGSIEGFYTNGQTQVLGDFGVANFTNEEGLEEIGGSYLRRTPNVGARTLGTGNSNVAGEIIGGALETSNVDTAEEFVRLIQAQRGFQANARVVTVQDELLQEVVNVV